MKIKIKPLSDFKGDFRKVFSVDNVLKLFQSLGFAPERGDYGPHNKKWGTDDRKELTSQGIRPGACLLGSLEHAMFGGTRQGDSLRKSKILSLHPAVLDALEGGWEDLRGFGFKEGALDQDGEVADDVMEAAADLKGLAQLQKDIIDAKEWGRALGRIFVDKATMGVDEDLQTAVLALHNRRAQA